MGLCAVGVALKPLWRCDKLADSVRLAVITRSTPTANLYGFEILLGVGAGCQAQTGYAVMQAMVDRSQISQAISFMLLGKFVPTHSISFLIMTPSNLAQRLGLTFGLSIAGSFFVNDALKGLQHALPSVPRAQLLGVITGTSGEGFEYLSRAEQSIAINTLTVALRKV